MRSMRPSGEKEATGIIVAPRNTQASSPAFSPKPWAKGAITGYLSPSRRVTISAQSP
ncbi:hypothetical protein FHR33_007233 [Nonomuraea dietziae]|uniref:Uncharacterized protein n=1 Tax=Nonomuraea dietziae TaxID=65515 RepID=A0A7W5YAX6_9ACTN|nr:hypothetical protein [Nonomuraea dietziae]